MVDFQPSILQEKISELESEGYYVDYFYMSFLEFKTEKTMEGGIFNHVPEWLVFLQEANNTRQELGFVKIWISETENVFWFQANEQTYYYHNIQKAD